MRRAKLWLRLTAHSLLLALLVAAGALAPATALDLVHGTSVQFCESLDSRGDHIDSQLSALQTSLHASWQQQSSRLSVMVREQQASSTALQRDVDTQRARNLDALRKQAGSSSQRTAIDDYQRTQANADSQRRKAVEAAADDFTAALKRYVADRQAAQAGQVEALRIALDDDIKTAENQCATGVDDATAAHDFQAALTTARQIFIAERKQDGAIVSQLQILNASRQNAVAAADQQYNSTMNHARQNL